MATNSLQSLQNPLPRGRHHLSNSQSSSSPLFLKLTTTTPSPSLSRNLSFTLYATTSSSSSTITPSSSSSSSPPPPTLSFDILQQHLSNQDFRQADEETRRLLIVLAGEAAEKRGYVFFSEVQFIPETELKTIDTLWRKHSNDKFGYSVQKRIWQKSNKDFTKFFIKVGWMKKLDTDIEQYNYRAFPNEFIWELKDDTPDGHLPLTNALRGVQLLNSVLAHPAFQYVAEEEEEEEDNNNQPLNNQPSKPLITNNIFKTDYSF